MTALTDDDPKVTTLESRQVTDPAPQQTASPPQGIQGRLTMQQEAFIRDRFSTKLEDPRTGRRIRW